MEALDADWDSLYEVGGIVAGVFVAYSLITMVLLIAFGGAPETAAEAYDLLRENRIVGILRLDTLTALMPRSRSSSRLWGRRSWRRTCGMARGP